ncbi:MAG: hypothetical protein OEY23_02180 [Acidimicrobiia bacterium]|nr:hypothetical protein [Acidimicrobiia bacterium]
MDRGLLRRIRTAGAAAMCSAALLLTGPLAAGAATEDATAAEPSLGAAAADCTNPADCIVIVSGDPAVTVTDDHPTDPAPLEARVVQHYYADAYTSVPGAQWISDQWITDGGVIRQAKTFERYSLGAPGARLDNANPAPCVGVVTPTFCGDDFGEGWHSRRTYHVPVVLPPGTRAVGATIQLAVDNAATVVVNRGEPGAFTMMEPGCDSYGSCPETNFQQLGAPADAPGSAFRPGANTVDITVDDWGSVTGIAFRLSVQVTTDPTGGGNTCEPGETYSCSLTVRQLGGGRGLYCYEAIDGETRQVTLDPTGNGELVIFDVVSGTDTVGPLPADGVVYYPSLDYPIDLVNILDDRCGA